MVAPYIKERWHPTLHVLTSVFNSPRYRIRYDLYEKFRKHIEGTGDVEHHHEYASSPNVPLYTAELAFVRRKFAVTQANDPRDLQLRTGSELWHKERTLNLLIRSLPQDWKYVAWVDADITFVRHDWAEEAIHMLQHYPVVQLWGEALDLDPNENVYQKHVSFMKSYQEGAPRGSDYHKNGPYGGGSPPPRAAYWHPGFAWAMRREAWNQLGGLIDFAILGAADNHMAKALIGDAQTSYHQGVSQSYKDSVLRWQDRAEKYVRRNVGFVEGTILHHYHGSKVKRRYRDRWKILVETGFDPYKDIKPDWQGLWQLEDHGDPHSIMLRDRLREYFHQRDEDDHHFEDKDRKI